MSRLVGYKHTEATLLKMSNAQKGRKLLKSNHEGKIHNEETRMQMKQSSKERWLKLEEKEKVSGENSKFWKGGKYKGKSGYILTPEGYKHRTVMEKYLGRKLLLIEVVHHKNYNRSDNRFENLELFPNQSEHIAYHAKER